ncbi:MAG: hypothetical protein MJ070_06370, partial [Lachnospiraceae bacterium]|nr:hypothetical protein [Lachnospiraceae bacterium]
WTYYLVPSGIVCLKQGEIIFGDLPTRSASPGVFALRAAASALSEAPRPHQVGSKVTEKGGCCICFRKAEAINSPRKTAVRIPLFCAIYGVFGSNNAIFYVANMPKRRRSAAEPYLPGVLHISATPPF